VHKTSKHKIFKLYKRIILEKTKRIKMVIRIKG